MYVFVYIHIYIYICIHIHIGQTIVLYNEKDKRQRFIQGPEITDMITAFATGAGKRYIYMHIYTYIYR
jgi:hypothetical protein